MVLDRYGPRITYHGCWFILPFLVWRLRWHRTLTVYSRLALSIVGCGFVIGIRMVAEWLSSRLGRRHLAAGATLALGDCLDSPSIAAATAFLAVGQINWRFAIALTGMVAAVYGVIYFFSVQDTPPGKVYERSASSKGLEVTTSKDFWFMLLMNIPLIGILGVIAWRLNKLNHQSNPSVCYAAVCLYAFQSYNCWRANKD